MQIMKELSLYNHSRQSFGAMQRMGRHGNQKNNERVQNKMVRIGY